MKILFSIVLYLFTSRFTANAQDNKVTVLRNKHAFIEYFVPGASALLDEDDLMLD